MHIDRQYPLHLHYRARGRIRILSIDDELLISAEKVY